MTVPSACYCSSTHWPHSCSRDVASIPPNVLEYFNVSDTDYNALTRTASVATETVVVPDVTNSLPGKYYRKYPQKFYWMRFIICEVDLDVYCFSCFCLSVGKLRLTAVGDLPR
jgi:hypothetical protein